MAAISSWQFMALPVSARTLAAASSALSFLVAAVLPFFCGCAAGAGLPRGAAADFLALVGRELEWVVLAALMVVSRVADLMEWLPIFRRREPPAATPRLAFR